LPSEPLPAVAEKSAPEASETRYQPGTCASCGIDRRDAVWALLAVAALAAITFLYALVLEDHNGWGVGASAYFAWISCTTIGLGDYAVSDESMHWSVVVLPVGLALVGRLIGTLDSLMSSGMATVATSFSSTLALGSDEETVIKRVNPPPPHERLLMAIDEVLEVKQVQEVSEKMKALISLVRGESKEPNKNKKQGGFGGSCRLLDMTATGSAPRKSPVESSKESSLTSALPSDTASHEHEKNASSGEDGIDQKGKEEVQRHKAEGIVPGDDGDVVTTSLEYKDSMGDDMGDIRIYDLEILCRRAVRQPLPEPEIEAAPWRLSWPLFYDNNFNCYVKEG